MDKVTIIVAGGNGSRMNTSVPKQFLPLSGLPVLMHTIKKFWNFDNSMQIIVVLPPTQFGLWKRLCREYRFAIRHTLRKGGDTRYQSVKNGLRGIKPGYLVAVHDGVRPLVSRFTIKRCFAEALKTGNAIPVVETCESVRVLERGKSQSADRTKIRLVQTPQVFESSLLRKAYRKPYNESFTDDATVVESLGVKINLVEGNLDNIKLTSRYDFVLAEALYRTTNLPLLG